MREFVRLSDNPDVYPQGWFEALADFIGLCTSTSAETEDFPKLIERVRSERRGPDGESSERKQDGKGVRGVVKGEWVEAIESIRDVPFDELRERFEAAYIHRSLDEAFTSVGVAVNSGFADGMSTDDAKKAVIDRLEERAQRHARGDVQAARLAVLAPAVLGRALPDRLRQRRQPARRCPSRCSR